MIHELKRQAEGHTSRHNNERDERERHEVFPLEYQDMVDAKTGEGPTNPHQNPDHCKRLTNEPDKARDVVHL